MQLALAKAKLRVVAKSKIELHLIRSARIPPLQTLWALSGGMNCAYFETLAHSTSRGVHCESGGSSRPQGNAIIAGLAQACTINKPQARRN